MKTCRKCGADKCATEFGKCATGKGGLQSYCKPCQLAFRRGYYAKHPERFNNKGRKGTYPFVPEPIDMAWLEKRSIPEPNTGCWLWLLSVGTTGYGQSGCGRRMHSKAHRVAWEIANKMPVPEGMWILHRCDNRICVAPPHLYAGTILDNTRDAVIRRRSPRILSVDQVRWIRKEASGGLVNGDQLRMARQLNVHPNVVREVVHGRSYRHVED